MPGRRRIGSRVARVCAPGSTASPRTSASTRSGARSAGRGRWSSGRPRPPIEASLAAVLPEHSWISPIADDRVLPIGADPAELAEARESIRLAFVAALQRLPARQRAVLILCEVLRWQASEVAELLETSVPAVNSALQRARATLSSLEAGAGRSTRDSASMDSAQRELLARFADAFERYDIELLVTLLRDDAIQSMPPYAMWLQGRGTSVGGCSARGPAAPGPGSSPLRRAGAPHSRSTSRTRKAVTSRLRST